MNEWIQEARLLSLGARKYGRERVKMQSLPNAVEYRNFLLLSHNIHCATFFHFHWAAFKLDPRRRLTVNGEYSNAAQKKKVSCKNVLKKHITTLNKDVSFHWFRMAWWIHQPNSLSVSAEWIVEHREGECERERGIMRNACSRKWIPLIT